MKLKLNPIRKTREYKLARTQVLLSDFMFIIGVGTGGLIMSFETDPNFWDVIKLIVIAMVACWVMSHWHALRILDSKKDVEK